MSVEKTQGHMAALLTVVVWSSTFVFLKRLLTIFHPLDILILRFTLSFIALTIAQPKRVKVPWKDELLFAIAGLTGVSIYYTLESLALSYTQASNVGVLVSISPFFTALLHRIFNHYKLGKTFVPGFIISFSGILIISFNGRFNLQLNPLGDVLALAAALGWSLYGLITPKFLQKGHSLPYVTRKIFFYGAIGMLPFSLIMDFKPNFSLLMQPENLLPFLYLALVSSCGGFVIWNFAVKHLGAVSTNLYLYLVPVLSIIFSALFLHEKITSLSILGSFLVLLGLAISEMESIRMAFRRRVQ